jgi:hypothetical protein
MSGLGETTIGVFSLILNTTESVRLKLIPDHLRKPSLA